jgi:hypothetical protein
MVFSAVLAAILRDARKCALLRMTAAGVARLVTAAPTPAKIRHPTRMISLLTSNRPDEARSNGRIDTDDFHDRKPLSLTMTLTALSLENNRP